MRIVYDAGRTVYLPIDVFGEMSMYADPWHTNGTGYALIAPKLARAIVTQEQD